MIDTYNLGECVIAKQELRDNSTLINAGTFNNIILDDPFRYYSEKILSQSSELKNTFRLVEMFINKYRLKERFLGSHPKYEELMRCFIDGNKEKLVFLDDGYKSIISCIINVTKHFEYHNEDYFFLKENSHLIGKITTDALELSYQTIHTYEEYLETANFAENLKKKIDPYIICATTYGNFFKFGNLMINEIENIPFIPEKIRFKVSNTIIPNLIEPLYGDAPECGLREIVQNACDAMKELDNKDKIKDYIEVRIQKNNDEMTLKVRDYGIGMTKDILLNKYFVIGESSKKGKNQNLVGQFGIGALAAFLLGDNITVKTKDYKDNRVYSFEYSPDSNEKNPIAVLIIEDESFEHGTEVCIKLKETLSELEKNKLERILKINEWYVMPDCEIKYFYNDDKQEIKSFLGKLYEWISVSHEKAFDIKYLDNKKTEKDGVFKIDNNFYNNPKIIYNGLMVPTPYELGSRYLKKEPFISVASSGDDIELNLERSRLQKGLDLIVEPVKKELFKRGLNIFEEEKTKIVSEDGIILNTIYNNDYIKNIPLFFTKNGFGIVTSQYIGGDFIEIYGATSKININDLSEGIKYIFKDFIYDKSILSRIIGGEYIGDKPIERECIIDSDIIEQFFYYANGYQSGFGKGAMQRLYKNLFPKVYNEYLYSDTNKFWEEHNKIKKDVFKPYFEKSQSSFFIPKDGKCEELLKDIKDKTKARIVAFSQMYSDKHYCEDILDIGIVR